ncbi:MAG: cytochrome c biogenesis protein CcsA [Candidatus Omnitrophota bacterium]|nr:cytochrome c biogenesis protein CcsA [Candidatus Omnitrophota bacterium]
MFLAYLNLSFGAYFLSMVFYAAALFSKNRVFSLAARFFITCAILALSIYIGMRWQIALRPPLSNMFESLVVFSWDIAVLLIFIDLKYKIKGINALTALMGLSTLGCASLLDKDIVPLLPALKSNWLILHVLTCFIGYAALTVAFVSSVIILCKKEKNANLDNISHKTIAFGFLFLTLGIISGSIWANSAWGTYWSWDPKETWSLITWVIYAIYLHVRLRKRWRGQKAAWLSVVGFTAMLFTYFGVNYLLVGLHSYAQ